MLELKKNYPSKRRKRNALYNVQSKGRQNTTKHVLECQTAETVYKIRVNINNQWAEVVKLYKQNKELRK